MKSIYPQIFQDCSNKLIGLDYEKYDCWGVAREFYRLIYNAELQLYSYLDPLNTKDISTVIKKQLPDYSLIEKPQFGDIILLRLFGLPCHVGIYLDENKFLHTKKGTGSIVDSIPKWKNRIIGFYRWQK